MENSPPPPAPSQTDSSAPRPLGRPILRTVGRTALGVVFCIPTLIPIAYIRRPFVVS